MYFNQIIKAGSQAMAFSRDRGFNDERGACRRGGRRFGAGRKKGCGKWGEETVVMRIPKSRVEEVIALLENSKPVEMI